MKTFAVIVDLPMIYDIDLDERRPATQRDIDLLVNVARTFGMTSEALRDGDVKRAKRIVIEHRDALALRSEWRTA